MMPISERIPDLAPPPIPVQELTAAQILSLRYSTSVWLGDFNIPGFGAGNLRIGPFYDPDRPEDPRSTAFLFDCNLVDLQRLAEELSSATLVLGDRDFRPQSGSRLWPDGVEVALTRVVKPAYWQPGRTDDGYWVSEIKLLGAAVPTSDLRELSAGQGLSFYVRLVSNQATLWINRDGVPYRNFDLPEEILLLHSTSTAA